MLKTLMTTTTLTILGLASAHAATVRTDFLGGRFNTGFTSGYIDAVGFPGDNTGMQDRDQVQFSRGLNGGPGGLTLTMDSPVFGELTMDFTQLISLAFVPAGEFYTMGDGAGGFISVNLPYYSIASFGFTGLAQYTPYTPPVVTPPPVIVPPPMCTSDCDGPPPPCVTMCGGDTPPPVTAIPEPSTWALLVIGFLALGYTTRRRPTRAQRSI